MKEFDEDTSVTIDLLFGTITLESLLVARITEVNLRNRETQR